MFSQQLRSYYYSPHSFQLMKNKAALSSQQEDLSIFHNNIRSLNLNLENLHSHLLDELDNHFNIIGLTETKITSNSYVYVPRNCRII